MKIGILGAGLSGLSLAYFLRNDKIGNIEILEKEQVPGGLCRSFNFNSISYDIGPHIIFSKDKEVLDFMVDLLGSNVNKLKRSNKIFYKGKFVKYPFENELSALPEKDKLYCLNSFLNNAYEDYKPGNLLQFFLTNFGEGITNTYLRPYNEKIWKFDPAFMDTQMVQRIPKPPREDIIKSADGVQTEGYSHQLHFHYPQKGGIASLIKAFADRLDSDAKITTDFSIENIRKSAGHWIVTDTKGVKKNYDRIVSTIPVTSLTDVMGDIVPENVRTAARNLKYNSIIICIVNVKKDYLGNNFAILVPDKEIIFHRLNKVNFLMPDYKDSNDSVTLMAEITFRKGDLIDNMSNSDIASRTLSDLEKLGFIDSKDDYNSTEIKRFKYAYVIYDLSHKKNMKVIKDFYENDQKVLLSGRFGEFEYLNMDSVIKRSMDKLNTIKEAL